MPKLRNRYYYDISIHVSLFFFIVLPHKYAFLNTSVLPASEIYEKIKFYAWLLLVSITLLRFIWVEIWTGSNNKEEHEHHCRFPMEIIGLIFNKWVKKIGNY